MRLRVASVSIPLVAACAPWAAGARLPPRASGIVGAWAAPAAPGSADTTVLEFASDGTASEARIEPSGTVRRVPWGPFRIYADSGARHLLCFAFRRSRALPACRYYRVVSQTDSAGEAHRRLELLHWVEQADTEVQVWRERVAP
ncbi:MAG TPA: hypothetical protein VH113_02360 [Gemmatimonadales bacterium]|jgi:hypothetical protein|nr:hypothetical protein [Gemmatimonadales bacterium]